MLYLVSLSLLTLSLAIGNSAISLFLGILLALLFRLPQDFVSKKYGTKILQTGIVFLGGSLSLGSVYETNLDFFLWISLFVILALGLVFIIGKFLGISEKLSFLLASGTAVCGGTAIASVAPSIKAKPEDVTTALTIIFLLNAIAVILFPIANEYIGLTERQFGAWAALAIHDTASVVGAASTVGEISVEVAATLKVARTIWIVPLVVLSAWYFRGINEGNNLPIFIVFFILATLLNSIFELNQEITSFFKSINKVCLLIGLFCIGTQISIENLKTIKPRPIFLATFVWILIIPASLFLVQSVN